MNKIIRLVCRMVIACTFVFSGFTKAVDPVGFAIKIEEYLVSFHMDWLSPIALPVAIMLIAIEFLLGFYLLIGFHIRKMAPLVLIMISGFLLLTLYTAVFNPVSDCGCFGDAVKLSNWATFWKNVVLMVFTLGLFYYRNEFEISQLNNPIKIISAVLGIVYIVGLQVYSYNNLPIIDFRPYKIGTNIADDMTIPKGAQQPEFETTFILEKDGVQQTFSMENYPYEDTAWVFVNSETRIIKEGYVPPLQNFAVLNYDLQDETYKITKQSGPLFLMISHRLDKVNKKSIKKFAELSQIAQQVEIPFYCITSSDTKSIQIFEKENNAMFDYLQCDETALKTIVRSNPALLLLHDGTIVGKWHFKNIPDKEIMDNPLSYTMKAVTEKNSQFVIWFNIFLVLIAINLLFINIKNTKI